jgi:hypothetical protein
LAQMKWYWCHHFICPICNSKLKNHSWLPQGFMKLNDLQKNDWVRDWNWLKIAYAFAGISNWNDGSNEYASMLGIESRLNSAILTRNNRRDIRERP